MATYQVRSGHRFGGGNQYGPGDKIELSVEEAAGFLDKLVLVEESGDSDTGGTTPWHGLDPKIVDLLEAAEVTAEMVPTMTDEELTAIEDIGPKTVQKIRSAFSGDAE